MPKRKDDTLSTSPENAVLLATKLLKSSVPSLASIETESINTVSALLKLPGELLNTICEYILTSYDLLEYVKGLNVPIDARSPGTKSDMHNMEPPSSVEETNYPVPDEHQHGSEGVSDPDNCIPTIASAWGSVQNHYLHQDGREFNQLKYVCKKLWRETHLLELKFNGVLFVDKDGTGVDQIEHFLAACSPSQRKWLKDITILAGEDDYEFDLVREAAPGRKIGHILAYAIQSGRFSKLEAFCFSCPWMRIRLVPKAFRLTTIVRDDGSLSPAFTTLAFSMYYILRNAIPTGWDGLVHPFRFAFEKFDRELRRDDQTPPFLQAPNVRIYPCNLLRGIGIAELLEGFQIHINDEIKKPFLIAAREWLTSGM